MWRSTCPSTFYILISNLQVPISQSCIGSWESSKQIQRQAINIWDLILWGSWIWCVILGLTLVTCEWCWYNVQYLLLVLDFDSHRNIARVERSVPNTATKLLVLVLVMTSWHFHIFKINYYAEQKWKSNAGKFNAIIWETWFCITSS